MKNILIIGAGRGIGLATAKILSKDHKVIAISRTKTQEILDLNVEFYEKDILKDSLEDINLPEEIHGLVYCPGTIVLKPFSRLTEEDFINDFKINFLGSVKTIQYLLPALKKSKNASILFYSTVAAKIGMPFHASIASSKSAVEGLVISLATELANYNIRVNAIAPSITQTSLSEKLLSTPEKVEASANRHPLKRIGTAEEMANISAFLLSDNASWITGQIISVDGGLGSIKIKL